MLTTIATVDFSKVQNGFGQYAQYLSVPKTDTYATLCILTSLYLVNKCILDNNECMNYIDPNGWLGAMSVLSSSNHKKINAAALLKMLNYMNETVIQANAGLIFRYIVLPIENYKNSTSTVSPQRPEHRRPNSNQLSPSKRKINYMNKDPAVNINLLVSLKHTINSLKNRGIFFENWLNTEERHRFEELLKDGHHRSSSK